MRPSFRVGLRATSCTAALLVAFAGFAGVAEAQPKPPPPPGSNNNKAGQFSLRHEEAGGQAGQTARARARSGDCAAALPDFDAAIRESIDPTLRRDRGSCHDKLGNKFPAIDDYRAYLTARPDAPDSDAIRQRLATLESTTEGSGNTGAGTPPVEPGGGTGQEASASVTVGSRAVYANPDGSSSDGTSRDVIGPKPGEAKKPFDYYVEQEQIVDAAKRSPLRYGKGLVLGPFLNLPRFFFGTGARSDFGYAAGGTLRYSTGPAVSLISEIGFSGIGKSGEASAQSGPLFMGGIEGRIALSPLAGDHLLLRAGIGYERNVVSGTRATLDSLLGRFAVGFRHVWGSSIALEALADGGPLLAFPEGGSSRVNAVIGASVALVVGF